MNIFYSVYCDELIMMFNQIFFLQIHIKSSITKDITGWADFRANTQALYLALSGRKQHINRPICSDYLPCRQLGYHLCRLRLKAVFEPTIGEGMRLRSSMHNKYGIVMSSANN